MTTPPPVDVPALLSRWSAAGIISPEQAQRLRADYDTIAPPRPISIVAEGLGYLGGVIVFIGIGLVLGLSWRQLGPVGQIGIIAGIAVALLAAGALIPAGRLGATGTRLRGVLWFTGTIVTFPAIILAATEWLDLDDWAQYALLASAGCAVVSAVLWYLNHHVLQHLTTIVAATTGVYAGANLAIDDSFLNSLAIWGVGVVWFILSVPNVIPAKGGGVLGAITATTGGLFMIGEQWGPAMALGTVVALVVTAVVRRDLPGLAIASIGTLIVLPFAVGQYLDVNTLTTALLLIVVGLALVATGVVTARRRPNPPAA